MNETKTTIIYENHDPNQSGVTFVAIQTETQPPYVWATYFIKHREDLPRLSKDLLIVPVEQAKKLFDFEKGTLADLVSFPIFFNKRE